ncbi:MAG: hypothetical protein WB646_12995 [Steroidobacteraceae bacterium]
MKRKKKTRKKKSIRVKPKSASHEARFDQLLTDAILGVEKK